MVSWLFPFPPKKGDLGITKHVYEKKNNQKLTLMARLNFNWELSGHTVDSNKYTLTENSSDEILEVVKEYFKDCNKFNYSDLQKKFNMQRVKRGIEIIEEEKSLDVVEKYRLYSRVNSEGALGSRFLKNNY